MGDVGLRQRVARWLEDHRGLVVVVVVLPLSLLFHFFMQFRLWLVRTLVSAPEKHDQRVRQIQKQVCALLMKEEQTMDLSVGKK